MLTRVGTGQWVLGNLPRSSHLVSGTGKHDWVIFWEWCWLVETNRRKLKYKKSIKVQTILVSTTYSTQRWVMGGREEERRSLNPHLCGRARAKSFRYTTGRAICRKKNISQFMISSLHSFFISNSGFSSVLQLLMKPSYLSTPVS